VAVGGELGKAVLELTTEGKNFTAGLSQAHKDAEGWGGKVGGIAKAAIFGLAGITVAVGGALAGAAREAAQEETGIFRLAQSVQNAGGNWDELRDSIEKTIHAQEMQTAFSDEEQRDALSLLVALTGDASEGMRRLPVAMDLARGAGIDLTTASRLLGKVTDENVGVLRRYGITVEKGADATDLLDKVTAKFGGQAKTFGTTAAGQYQILQNELSNLTEQIGAAVLPGFVSLAQGALGVVEGLRAFAAQPEVIAFFGNLWTIVTNITSVLGEMFGVITGSAPDAGAALSAIAGPDIAKAVMSGLAAIREIWTTFFAIVHDITSGNWDVVADDFREGALRVDELLRNMFGAAMTAVQGLATQIIQTVVGAWPQIQYALGTWAKLFIDWVGPAALQLVQNLLGMLGDMLHWVADHSEEIGATLVEWGLKFGEFIITTAIPKFLEYAPQIIGTIVHWALFDALPTIGMAFFNLGKGIIGKLADAFGTAVHDIWEALTYMLSQAFAMIDFWVGPFHVTGHGISVEMPEFHFPSFQTGGVMPWTGLALVHKGETITPAGQPGGAGVGSADVGGHGHPLYLDGRLVGGLLNRRTMRGAELAGAPIG